MKKFYSFLVMALVALTNFQIKADDDIVTIKVVIDDVTRVDEAYFNWGDYPITWTGNEGVVSIPKMNSYGYDNYANLYLQVNSADYYIVSCTRTLADGTSSNVYIESGTYYCSDNVSFSGTSDYNNMVYTITTADWASSRNATFTCIIDDATNVNLYCNNYYPEIATGTNTIKYNDTLETNWYCCAKDYSSKFYKVTVDGVEVTTYGSSYSLSAIHDGSTVEITTKYPEEPCTLTFTFTNEGTEGVVKYITVAGERVEPETFLTDGYTAMLGDVVYLYFDQEGYTISEPNYYNSTYILVNDTYTYAYDGMSIQLSGNTTINITATKNQMLAYTIDIDNADNAKAWVGTSQYYFNQYSDPIALVNGLNSLEISSKTPWVFIKAADSACYIESCTVNGTDATYNDYRNYYSVTVEEGSAIVITTGAIERDKTFVLYINDYNNFYSTELSTYGGYMENSSREDVDLASGYTTHKFADQDNQFGLCVYNGKDGVNMWAYLNDEPYAPYYDGGSTYYITFADQDVFKFYVAAEEPTAHGVTFEISGAEVSNPSIVKDLIKEVTDPEAGLLVLPGTQIDIKDNGDYQIDAVTANDVDITPVDGVYTLTITAPTTIKITAKGSGIINIAGDNAANGEIYNLQGIRVNNTQNLPAGIYIQGGQKIYVK
ncbi:MAG: hypothetical protein LIP02_02245 [Bacteroidales bacterium]|nr:hypothetical protein [Bacteroidales bacterium]